MSASNWEKKISIIVMLIFFMLVRFYAGYQILSGNLAAKWETKKDEFFYVGSFYVCLPKYYLDHVNQPRLRPSWLDTIHNNYKTSHVPATI